MGQNVSPEETLQQLYRQAAEYYDPLQVEDPTRIEQLHEWIECRWHYFQAEDYEQATGMALSLSEYLAWRCGYYTRTLELLYETLPKVTSEEYKATCYNNIGVVYGSQGQSQEALAYYEKSRKIWERSGRVMELIALYGSLGVLCEGLENYEKAEEFVSNAVQLSEQVGHPQLEACCRTLLDQIRQKRNGAA